MTSDTRKSGQGNINKYIGYGNRDYSGGIIRRVHHRGGAVPVNINKLKQKGMYKVYFSDGVNAPVELAAFENLTEAKEYVCVYLQNEMLVDNEHGCTDDVFLSSAVAYLEIYEGEAVRVDEYGNPYPAIPVYESEYFYTK